MIRIWAAEGKGEVKKQMLVEEGRGAAIIL